MSECSQHPCDWSGSKGDRVLKDLEEIKADVKPLPAVVQRIEMTLDHVNERLDQVDRDKEDSTRRLDAVETEVALLKQSNGWLMKALIGGITLIVVGVAAAIGTLIFKS